MNGQLNGFHEAFIEEGTFLFTSESVGEGHPGEPAGGLGEGEGRRAAALGGGSRPSPAAGRTGGRALPSWRREAANVRSSLPSPFLRSSSGGEPRHAEGSRNREGRGPRLFEIGAGRALLPPLLVPSPGKTSSGRPRPACSRPAAGSARPALQRLTTCSPHVGLGRSGAGGLYPPDSPWVWKWGGVGDSKGPISIIHDFLPLKTLKSLGWTCPQAFKVTNSR